MLHRDDEFSRSKGLLFIALLVIAAFAIGFAIGGGLNNSVIGNEANLTNLSTSDKNFLVQVVGGAVLEFSDRYCEKNGLRPDLLPQVLNVPDQNTGENRSIEYFVPVCVR